MSKATEKKWATIGSGNDGEMTENWDFEVNPELIGVYESKKDDVGPNHSEIYVINKDGNLFSIWENTVLRGKFQLIPFGTDVQVMYHGMAKGKNGKYYKNFSVNVPSGTSLLDGTVA